MELGAGQEDDREEATLYAVSDTFIGNKHWFILRIDCNAGSLFGWRVEARLCRDGGNPCRAYDSEPMEGTVVSQTCRPIDEPVLIS